MAHPNKEIEAQRNQYGPLTNLIGTWEGSSGDDLAPGDDRGIENNKYKEQIIFEPFGLVENHEQRLYVLKYATKIWRLGEPNTFHEELGYWTWDSATEELMRCFIIPRGIALIAGGHVQKDAKEFILEAKEGSSTYGICNGPFLEKQFKTLSYTFKMIFDDSNSIRYEQDTVLQMPGHLKVFHHRDKNALKRV